jgi:protein-S-isoprenylcysteine O-methyltransferase Ste14
MNAINNQNEKITFSTTTKIYILRGFIATAIGCCLFFLGAANWTISRGWIYFIIMAVVVFLSNIIVAKYNPGLLEQRSKMRKGSKKWDKLWLFTFMLFFMYGMPFIAGYDIGRLGNQIGGYSLYIGILLFLLSVALSTWAMAVNKFFETTVRIQDDRGHYVITDGPYQFVRHPGYSAMIFWATGFPLTVGSLLALYVGIPLLFALALRTYLEDRTLQRELIGYVEYTQKVRYRLIPYIW